MQPIPRFFRLACVSISMEFMNNSNRKSIHCIWPGVNWGKERIRSSEQLAFLLLPNAARAQEGRQLWQRAGERLFAVSPSSGILARGSPRTQAHGGHPRGRELLSLSSEPCCPRSVQGRARHSYKPASSSSPVSCATHKDPTSKELTWPRLPLRRAPGLSSAGNCRTLALCGSG